MERRIVDQYPVLGMNRYTQHESDTGQLEAEARMPTSNTEAS